MILLKDIPLLLASKHWPHRSDAVKKLTQISIEDALPYLDIAIKDEEKYVRQAAIELMSNLASKAFRPLLEIALVDDYSYNRQLAFTGLSKIYEPSLFTTLDTAINRLGEETKTRMNMIWQLRFLENDHSFTPTILKWIKVFPSKEFSYILMEVVKAQKDKSMIPAILEFGDKLKKDPSSHSWVVKTLAALKATEGLNFVLNHAGHEYSPDNYSDSTCLEALVEVAAPELYLEKLVGMKGRKKNILVEAIGLLKYKPALDLFVQQFFKTKDINYRLSLARALNNLGYISTNTKDKILLEIVQEHWEEAKKGGEEACEVLRQVTKSYSYKLARKAIKLLGTIGKGENDVLVLSKQVNSSNNRNRLQAIEALGKLGSSKGIAALVEYLDSDGKKEPHFDGGREKALRALAQIGDLSVIPFLIELLRDNPSVSGRNEGYCNTKMLINVLGDLHAEEAIPFLVPYLLHNNASLVEAAKNSLTKLNWTPDHLQNNIRWLTAHKDWDAIVRLGTSALKPLIRITEDKTIGQHEQLMLCLAKIGDEQALDHILKWLFKPFYKHHQIDLFEKLIPYFTPLFGELTTLILEAASFIDCIITINGSSTYYKYSLETAIKATKMLQQSKLPLAALALSYVSKKQPVLLTDSEHEEYGGGSLTFGFEEQQSFS